VLADAGRVWRASAWTVVFQRRVLFATGTGPRMYRGINQRSLLTNEAIRRGLPEEIYATHSITPSKELLGLRGLWQYLITRSQLKAKIEIERERNKAYAEHRDRLPDNAELMDYEDNQGRRFWVRKNQSSGVRPGAELPLIAVVWVESAQVTGVPCLADDELTGETTP
jgi:hypothetical protein